MAGSMSGKQVRLLAVNCTLEHDSPPKSTTIQPGQLTDTTPTRSPKPEKSWNYVRTPMPSALSLPPDLDCSSSSTLSSSMAVPYVEPYVSMSCFIYYDEKGKLRRKLIVAELKSDLSLEEAIRRMTSYCTSLQKLNKRTGRVYRAATIAYEDFQEMHATLDAVLPLRSFNSHYFVFDTTGYIAKKTPVTLTSFPMWYM